MRRKIGVETKAPQKCQACGALVRTFTQWFEETCAANPEGHDVLDWVALTFEN
jgi:hypothetical protein